MTQILYYWPDPADPALGRARTALLPLRHRLRAAAPDQTGQQVGFLLGRRDFEAQAGEPGAVPDPILILDGLTPSQLDAVLRALARAKVPRTVFKAVATADNVNWTLFQLWEELKQEREALERGDPPAHTT